MLKAIIFDLDGILVDSEPLHFEAHKVALKEFGIDLTREDYMEFGLAKGDWDLYKKMAEKFNVNIDEKEISAIKHKAYREIFDKNAVPREGAIELVESLNRNDYDLAIASSGSKKEVMYILEKFAIKKYFKVIVTGNDVEKVKPAPYIYNKAVELLGVSKEDCIAIEDSATGLAAAKNAGIKCIAVPCSFTKGQDFSAADLVLDNLGEITKEKINNL